MSGAKFRHLCDPKGFTSGQWGEKIKWNYSREQRAGIMERERRGKNGWLSGFKVGIIKNKKSNSENSKKAEGSI